jgi:mono/diheme cytochrome c family protein
MTLRTALPALVLACAAFAAACGPSRRSEAILGPPPLKTPREKQGEVLFMRFCHQCHPSGSGGLGPGLNNKPAPAAAIRLQIREGLGAMPAFGKEEIKDAEVDAIIDYMMVMRSYESEADD